MIVEAAARLPAGLGGGIDYTCVDAYAVVPIEGRRLRAARVVWLNHRWFTAQGIDIANADHFGVAEDWVRENFAFQIPAPRDAAGAFTDERRVFYADRYGGAGLGSNGGSGRCAGSGGFQVKGIGATPLVGALQDEYHSNGAVTLEEGIREAIFSEVAPAEFPLGTAPIVAVIDTGTRVHWKADSPSEPRALVVRVNIVRGGHFERAVRFLPRQFSKSDHLADAARVQAYVRAFRDPGAGGFGGHVSTRTLAQFAEAMAAQMAFGFVHRLSLATYTSSNVGIDGQVMDFGATRTMPSWETARTTKGMPPFGAEAQALRTMLESIGFYLSKYARAGGSALAAEMELEKSSACSRIEQAVDRELRRLVGTCVDDAQYTANFCRELRETFREQQARFRDYYLTPPGPAFELWTGRIAGELLGPALAAHNAGESPGEFPTRLAALARNAPRFRTSVLRVAQVFTPRMALDRDALRARGYAELVRLDDPEPLSSRKAHEFVNTVISQNRRVWRHAPADCAVLGQTVRGSCTALLLERCDGGHAALIEGPALEGAFNAFGAEIPLDAIAEPLRPGDGGRMSVMLEGAEVAESGSIRLGGVRVELPPLEMYFRDPLCTRPSRGDETKPSPCS